MNKQYVVIKEQEKSKRRAKEVIQVMRDEGHVRFGPFQHTQLWKARDAKNPRRKYCVNWPGFAGETDRRDPDRIPYCLGALL